MPTGLQLFDISNLGASVKGQKAMPGGTKPASEAASDQLAGFMEIMSALLALPPDQWKQSLAGLDAASTNCAGAAAPPAVGNSGQSMAPAELLKLLMNMKGEVLQQLRSAEAQGDPHALLDLAETLAQDPQAAVQGNPESGLAQTAESSDSAALFQQAEGAVQEEPAVEPGEIIKTLSVPGMDRGAGNALAGENANEGEKKNPVVRPAETSNASRRQNPADGFLFKTSDGQMESAASPATDKDAAKLASATAIAAAQDTPPDEQVQLVDKAHQVPTADIAKNSTANAQLQVDGENLEERLVQRSEAPVTGHQQLWKTEAGQQTKGLSASGGKEVMGEEKTSATDVIRQIVQRMSMQTNGAQSKMVIRLKPEFLGNVHMQVVTENHQVTVRMMADSTLVKEIVEQNLSHLKAELQHHGLEIQKFDVFVANDDQGWRSGQEQAGFRDARNQKQPRSGEQRARNQRGKIPFDTGQGRENVQKDPGEINYFA
jgi:flagellar hook-length control protein FliK